MGPQDRSFSQVKAILGKLDRSIDQLREQRTGAVVPVPVVSQVVSRVIEETPPAAVKPSSPFGRATPLPPRP
ncbi:MAG: hypothetical protein HRU70_08165 [Phycisphaeraceae bacterium]|nr:MAG: hypothetical protein HRU70_08165 [Phycisphaeraceae bacterium]